MFFGYTSDLESARSTCPSGFKWVGSDHHHLWPGKLSVFPNPSLESWRNLYFCSSWFRTLKSIGLIHLVNHHALFCVLFFLCCVGFHRTSVWFYLQSTTSAGKYVQQIFTKAWNSAGSLPHWTTDKLKLTSRQLCFKMSQTYRHQESRYLLFLSRHFPPGVPASWLIAQTSLPWPMFSPSPLSNGFYMQRNLIFWIDRL